MFSLQGKVGRKSILNMVAEHSQCWVRTSGERWDLKGLLLLHLRHESVIAILTKFKVNGI